MFRRYQNEEQCYVYPKNIDGDQQKDEDNAGGPDWETTLKASNRFAQGRDLQELSAPRNLEFYPVKGGLLDAKRTVW